MTAINAYTNNSKWYTTLPENTIPRLRLNAPQGKNKYTVDTVTLSQEYLNSQAGRVGIDFKSGATKIDIRVSYDELINSQNKAQNNDQDTEEITEENYVIMSRDTTGKPVSYYKKATEQQLEWGGEYLPNADGTISFHCPKEDWLNGGTQGIKDELDPRSMGSRSSELVLNALEKLPVEKREIADQIDIAASRAGLSDEEVKKLKIEVSNGKIVVGGLKDKAAQKRMEQALNEIDGLPKKIEDFQFEEKVLYDHFNTLNATNMQVMDGGREIKSGMDYLEWRINENDGDIDSLTGLGDNAIAYAAAEYFRDPIETADFSHKLKGVANPVGDMESALFDLKNKIADEVMKNNWNFDDNDPNHIDAKNITFRITSSGKIEFGGKFSTSETTNNHAKTMLQQVIEEAMMQREDGSESVFTTALERMITMHEEEYGSEGVEKEAVFEFGLNSPINAYVDDKTGDAEAIAKENIGKSIADYVNSVSPDEKVDKSEFSISEDGKIRYTGMTSSAAQEVVGQLNSVLEKAQKFGTHILDMDSPINKLAVDIIKNLNSLDSYGPKASKGYLNYTSPGEQHEKRAEKFNKWVLNQSLPYTTNNSKKPEAEEAYARWREQNADNNRISQLA